MQPKPAIPSWLLTVARTRAAADSPTRQTPYTNDADSGTGY